MTPIFLHWSPSFPGETYFAVCRTCAVGVLCRDPPSWKWWVSVDPITIEVVEKLWDSSVLFVGFDAALATLASSLKDSSKRSCRCRISRSVDSRTKKPLLGSSKLISKPGDRNEIFYLLANMLFNVFGNWKLYFWKSSKWDIQLHGHILHIVHDQYGLLKWGAFSQVKDDRRDTRTKYLFQIKADEAFQQFLFVFSLELVSMEGIHLG